jgi:Tfp pilus assembly protein PilF
VSPARRTALAVAAVVLGLAAAAGVLCAAARSSRSALLPAMPSGSWILYPLTPRADTRAAVELDTRFRKSIVIDRVPDSALLRASAFRRAEIRVNDVPVAEVTGLDGGSRRAPATLDVARQLRVGENRLEVTVWNDRGPPALWLDLVLPGTRIETDTSWESSLAGASWRPARPAEAKLDASRIDPDLARIRPAPALAGRAKLLVALAVLCLGIVLLAEVLERRFGPALLGNAALALTLVLWGVLFLNNAGSLSGLDGYDAELHLQYVQFLLHPSQPIPPEHGWWVFQPPLYHALTAVGLKLSGLSTLDASATWVLRVEGLMFGATQLVLLFLALRLVFPRHPRARLVGLLVAAFLPVQLYTYQLVGNDGLAATLGTAAIYAGLRVLTDPRPSRAAYVVLGACLGGALLAKLSTLVVVVVVGAALAAQVALSGAARRERAAGLLLAAIVALPLCAWHYGMLWWIYGSPLVGNWDPAVMSAWWQDPGYVTASYFLRFGDGLTAPLLSAVAGFPDGIYSTLWGDGLLAGSTRLALAPPWHGTAMEAGYALAVVPSSLIVVGAVVTLLRFVRSPDTVGAMVLAAAGATSLALVSWPLGHPIYSVVKASFGLPAVLCVAVFAGAGVERIAAITRWGARIAVAALLTWALNAYGTFWIPRDSAAAHARLGWHFLHGVARDEAIAGRHIAAALEIEPDNALALLGRAELLDRSGRLEEAGAQIGKVLAHDPDDARAHVELAIVLEEQGNTALAAVHYNHALAVRPWDPAAHLGMARILRTGGDLRGAVAHLRDALATIPDRPEIHRELAELLVLSGDDEREARHNADRVSSFSSRGGGGK